MRLLPNCCTLLLLIGLGPAACESHHRRGDAHPERRARRYEDWRRHDRDPRRPHRHDHYARDRYRERDRDGDRYPYRDWRQAGYRDHPRDDRGRWN